MRLPKMISGSSTQAVEIDRRHAPRVYLRMDARWLVVFSLACATRNPEWPPRTECTESVLEGISGYCEPACVDDPPAPVPFTYEWRELADYIVQRHCAFSEGLLQELALHPDRRVRENARRLLR